MAAVLYSCLSTDIGDDWAARRAGKSDAIHITLNRATITPAYVAPSKASTPNRKLRLSRPALEETGKHRSIDVV
jgi:hypothetical protein